MRNFGVGLKWSKRFWQYWASSAKQQSPIWKINTSELKRATNLHLLQKCWNQCWSEKNLFNLLANSWSKITKTTTIIEEKPQYLFLLPEFLDFYLFDRNVKTTSEKRKKENFSGLHFAPFDIFRSNFVLLYILLLGFVCSLPVKISDDKKSGCEIFLIWQKTKVEWCNASSDNKSGFKLISIICLRNCASNHEVIFQAQGV